MTPRTSGSTLLCRNSSSRAFASWRSRVPKPSVNQLYRGEEVARFRRACPARGKTGGAGAGEGRAGLPE
jgi:hypothetical protein